MRFCCLALLACALAAAPSAAELRLRTSKEVGVLAQGWEYRASAAGDWRPLDISHERPADLEGDEIWCRVRLPQELGGRDPALLLGHAFLSVEARVDGRLVYSRGTFGPERANRYLGLKVHMIPLPVDGGGRWLVLRFHSSYAQIGLHQPPYIGQRESLLRAMLKADMGRMGLAGILLVIGAFGIYVSLRRRDVAALALGGLALGVGGYTLGFAEARQLVWDRTVFWWYAGSLSFLAFPIGLWAFYERVIGGRCRVLIRRLWQAHVAYLLGALVLDLADVVPLPMVSQPFLLMLVGGMGASVLAGFRAAGGQGEDAWETRVLRGGMSVMMLFGLHDIMIGFGFLDFSAYVFHVGVFLFVLVLAYVLERRYARDQRRLQSQAERLEAANRSLEERVDERTRDLQGKNDELEAAYGELAGAKDQLVMQEKMAALGNLVAGVAHEINNPVGAINSAIDVLGRCVDRLKGGDAGKGRLVGVMDDNVRVMGIAGRRVADIVQTLKDFARLDQAERQRADLHEGLDSTLALVAHEFKGRVEVERRYGDLPQVDCRPGQINQVFMNLLVNASQAIDGPGRLVLETWQEGGRACVRVTDDGKGIGAADRARIFDPGFTTKGVGVGTGLGLSISYRIVHEHGGELGVESEEGRGASFTVRLPVAGDTRGGGLAGT